MKGDLLIDFILSLIVRFQGLIIRSLPLRFGLFIGGKIGGLGYYLAGRKRNVLAYENIKAALGDKLTPQQMKRILKNLYRNLGEGFVELLWMPKMDKKYLDKIFDSLVIADQTYYNVVKMDISIDEYIKMEMNLFFADSTGIIRKEIRNGINVIETYDLIESSVLLK